MHGANAHYGHRSILAAYAQVPATTPIAGLLQHGWNHDLGAVADDIRIPMPEPFYIWSERNWANCQRSGLRHVVALGAPFLYLPDDAAEAIAAEPGSLLAIPIHGWERERVQQDFAQYAADLGQIASQFKKITVCLYFFDHQFPQNREPFERLGMEVVTVGHRDDNPDFLPAMRRLIRRHEAATSNRVQTGLFYAMALGRKVFLHGAPMGVDPRLDHSGHLWDAWQAREFGQLAWTRYQGDTWTDLGLRELGAPLRRSPEALRELLLWQPDQRPELDRRVRAFAVRQSRGINKFWWGLTGELRRAQSLPGRSSVPPPGQSAADRASQLADARKPSLAPQPEA